LPKEHLAVAGTSGGCIFLSEVRVVTMTYKVVLEESDEGFAASVLGLPGCHSQGATEREALENITDALREYLEVITDLSRGAVVREVEVEV
jgi:predicted RNase H-like HicB family nuclease